MCGNDVKLQKKEKKSIQKREYRGLKEEGVSGVS